MPAYAVTAAGIATGASAQVLAIRPPAGNDARLLELRVFARAATLTPLALSRTSPISTAGTAITPRAMDWRARTNATAAAHTVTAGTVLGDLWNITLGAIGAGAIWIPPSPLIIPASGEIVLRNTTTSAGSAIDVGAVWDE